MAFEIRLTPSAVADLEEATQWIAQDSPDQARKWLAGAWEVIFSLSEMPERFAVIPETNDLFEDVRDARYHSHRVIFRIRKSESLVEVLRVWHGARRDLRGADIESDL